MNSPVIATTYNTISSKIVNSDISIPESPHIGTFMTIPQFLETTGELTIAERNTIVGQAITMIDNVYVHLPLKRAMHAVDPVQSLKLLRRRLDNISTRQFHNEMLKIFNGLHDLHTNYILPSPFNQNYVFLPFLMEEFYDDKGERHYIVTKLINGFQNESFMQGAEITHWNGVQIDQAVAINAEREAGSNQAARHVRGLDHMTVRPMAISLPPDEQWVIVGYHNNDQDYEIRLFWQVQRFPEQITKDFNSNIADEYSIAIGLDLDMKLTNQARKLLFAHNTISLREDTDNKSHFPDTFEFKTVETMQGEFGYLRIRTFSAPSPEYFVDEVIRILQTLPQSGLIIDVRNNGGGIIVNGERLLQLFSTHLVEAERLHFINNEITLAIANSDIFDGFAKRWAPSIDLSVTTGAVYSQGFPIESPDLTNNIGQRYKGHVVLITDARCYSTTDIFAAGFQDNVLGKILGVDDNTGAGGANVFDHELLQQILPGTNSPFQELPGGVKMRVAVRRTTRVGEHSGLPLEDLGVQPDEKYRMTRDDLLYNNRDLIAAAAALI